jgi:hypothetical protein
MVTLKHGQSRAPSLVCGCGTSFTGRTGKAANSEASKTAQNTLEARALFDAEERRVELRVARFEDAIWYDLSDEAWRAVKITPDGRSIEAAPAFFRRYGVTAPQVEPSRNGNLRRLPDFVNLNDDADKALFQIYAATCLVPDIPHPLTIFHGEKGAAKTTAMRVLRRVVDPSQHDLIGMSRSLQDLEIVLSHNYMPSFDNLDFLQGSQSNLLCSACTGGGISKRELYSDEDEIILSFRRCVTLNGINVVASRADLLDRSLLFELNRIEPENRKEESVFWREFEEALPEIMGGLFDTLSKAMAIYPTLDLKDLPRMADFARWGCAVAEALGIGRDKFLEYYKENIAASNQEAINANPIATAIVAFMDTIPENKKELTMSDLYHELGQVALSEHIDTSPGNKAWPKASTVLSKRLKHIISNLLDVGISVKIYKATSGKNKNRSIVVLEYAGHVAQQTCPIRGGELKSLTPQPIPQRVPFNQSPQGETYHIPGGDITDRDFPEAPSPHPSEALPPAESGASDSGCDNSNLEELTRQFMAE